MPCIRQTLHQAATGQWRGEEGTYISHRVRGKLLAVHTRGALQLQLRALSMHKGLVQLAVVPQQCGLQRGGGKARVLHHFASVTISPS